jgi:hypothetical protein
MGQLILPESARIYIDTNVKCVVSETRFLKETGFLRLTFFYVDLLSNSI